MYFNKRLSMTVFITAASFCLGFVFLFRPRNQELHELSIEHNAQAAAKIGPLTNEPHKSQTSSTISLRDNVNAGSALVRSFHIMIASKYSDFEDSKTSFCMHNFGIPQTYTDYMDIGVHACCEGEVCQEEEGLWIIDSAGYLRLASHENTCVKHKKDPRKGVGLSVCDPNDAISMAGAVRISSGQKRLDLSDAIDGNGTAMSFDVVNKQGKETLLREKCCTIELSERISFENPLRLWAIHAHSNNDIKSRKLGKAVKKSKDKKNSKNAKNKNSKSLVSEVDLFDNR